MITISVGIVSSLMYKEFVRSIVNQAYDASRKLLQETSASSNFLYELTNSAGLTMLNDHDIIKAIYSDSPNEQDILIAKIRLSNLMSSNPAIHSVSLYNKSLNKYFNTTFDAAQYDPELNTADKRLLLKRYKFLPRTLSYASGGKMLKENVLTYILSDSPSYVKGIDSSIIVNVSENYLRGLLDTMNTDHSSVVMIVDNNGIVISHPDKEQFGTDLSATPYIKEILASGKDSGHFIRSVNDHKTLITYANSPGLNWTFISLTSYDQLISSMNKLKVIILIICAIVLLLTGLASLILINRIYSPLHKLLKRVESNKAESTEADSLQDDIGKLSSYFTDMNVEMATLKESSKFNLPIVKENFLKQLLQGTQTEMLDIYEKYSLLPFSLDTQNFLVFILNIDGFEKLKKNYPHKGLSLLTYALSNIASELTGRYFRNECVSLTENQIIVMASSHERADDINKIRAIMESIQHAAASYLKLSVSCGIGDHVTAWQDIRLSYDSALKAIRYRFIFGPGSIIFHQQLESIHQPFEYPSALEKRLFDAIKTSNAPVIEDTLRTILQLAKEMSYENAMLLLTRLTFSTSELTKHLEIDDLLGASLFGLLNQAEFVRDVESALLEFFEELTLKLSAKRETGEMMNPILDYIRNHFSDPNLSAEHIADIAGISPQYFSKRFKEMTGQNYTVYLSSLRLSHAKELLSQSDWSIEEISNQTGFSNPSYFSNKFKREYGVSPNQYRLSQRPLAKSQQQNH